MISLKLREERGVTYLEGRLDHSANFRVLSRRTGALRLNFSRVTGFSEDGVTKFLDFVRHWAPQVIHMEGVPPELQRRLNLAPEMRRVTPRPPIPVQGAVPESAWISDEDIQWHNRALAERVGLASEDGRGDVQALIRNLHKPLN
jgi:hypothetical protein